MKNQVSMASRLAVTGLLAATFSAITVAAQDYPKVQSVFSTTATAPVSHVTTVHLSPGAVDVLKLAQAKIGEETIISFVKNSGVAYGLGASEIVYLRQQGASERVITAMLDQRGQAPVAMASAPPAPPNAYVAPAPAYVQPSTVYVAPPAPVYPYYDSYYGYYPYGGYYYPPVSLSFGFGFGGHYGDGGHRGGGDYHGGGGHGGRR